MASVLITGANRGLGLEFARQYSNDGWTVVAAVRNSSPDLDALGIRVEFLDLGDPQAVARFPDCIDFGLDLFIANAGTNFPMASKSAQDARDWLAMMMVNAIAPHQLLKSLLPRLSETRGTAIALSSTMGSIADNAGNWIPYRTSKAALNMAWSALATEARRAGVTAALVCPGWVKTRMGGDGAEITASESVTQIRALITSLVPADSGRFMNRDGSTIPW